jgi:hypothetical protein
MTASFSPAEKVVSSATTAVSDIRPKAVQSRNDLSMFGLVAPPKRGGVEWTDLAAEYAAPDPANWIA